MKDTIRDSQSIKGKLNTLIAQKENTEREIYGLKAALQTNQQMSRIYSILQLNYRPPPGFKKEEVYGRLLNLFSPKSSKYTMALEVIAGGNLFSVVVTDKNVSTTLLKHKAFQHFVSFIPLRQIAVKPTDGTTMKRIESQYPGKVIHSLKTIEYSKEIERAILFTFGSYFICENSHIAKEIIRQEDNAQ